MRVDHGIEKIPMLVVIGVTRSNQKIFLTIQQGAKDAAPTWREVFKDLKHRGLDAAKIQRCQLHVSRNVLCKVPQKMKKQ